MTDYPATHFVGTPVVVRDAVRAACDLVEVSRDRWLVPLEAIAMFESGGRDVVPPGACADCRGMMQQSLGQYEAAYRARHDLVPCIEYDNRSQAVVVAILYIKSELPGFGGYGGILSLLARDDRGPGEVLRAWTADPSLTLEQLRPFYHGY